MKTKQHPDLITDAGAEAAKLSAVNRKRLALGLAVLITVVSSSSIAFYVAYDSGNDARMKESKPVIEMFDPAGGPQKSDAPIHGVPAAVAALEKVVKTRNATQTPSAASKETSTAVQPGKTASTIPATNTPPGATGNDSANSTGTL